MAEHIAEFAGRLTQQLAWHRATHTADGVGGRCTSWAYFRTVWAEITLRPQSSAQVQGRLVARLEIAVRCRAEHGLAVHDRLEWQGDIFQIIEIARDPNQLAWISLAAARVTP